MNLAFTYDIKTLSANGSLLFENFSDLPGNAIPGPFPVLAEYQAARANEARTGWDIVEDYRAATVVDADGNPATVTDVGPLPDGYRVVTEDDPDVIAKALAEARAAKLAEIMQRYKAAFAPIEAAYPTEERETWPIQLEEARACLTDPSAETPMLSVLVAMRGKGESVADFAAIVMANNAAYRLIAGSLTGQQQRMYAEVNALDTVEAVLAYEVAYAMPDGASYAGM